ncbi:N-terminal methylation [Sulfurimonas denitrificans DSM 1251]|jgi:general secretion pathway protein G|uniref:N-terminal methylation n=1 Tax=Sulfurimonas denitrificans (strain ATCC 33889 / DSM 1251) TaxID=326298 RepID=Q30TN3_SULDN|nr:prepilin-type N-terminal cleavage/methylation domain-containing protein [Sulfurimonas denitrificans]ABB43648.1 N-terminal methylation [Sulfurimonas denitrificans DSM 1251]MDD3442537.1 type II secretion system protein [Sulfurimonas denitrificans]
MKLSSAFTLIELIFVIIVLSILASIALPKFANIKEMTDLAKGRADLATIRAAIANERSQQVIKGTYTYMLKLSSGTMLFNGDGTRTLLKYPMRAGTSSGEWYRDNDTTYRFKIGAKTTLFTYNPANGMFNCNTSDSGTDCKALAN